MRRFTFPFARIFWISLFSAGIFGVGQAQTTNRFGFKGPEIFPIDSMISQIRAADMNGDGKTDLILANNSRAKINILLNQTGETNHSSADAKEKRDLNELPPDSRFRIDSIASEKRISGLVTADLNSDGKPDLAYYGEPKELVVQYNEGTNGWSFPKRWQIGDETSLTPNSLTFGDINGDKRTDLLLLAENYIFVLNQNTNSTLDEPERIPFTGTVKSIQVLDINGDGRDDLLLVNWDDPNPFRFRLQNEAGLLGPEYYFSLPSIRSYWADDLDGDHRTEVMTIAQNSGRAQVSNFTQKDAEVLSGAFKEGQFQIMPLNKTTRPRRGSVWSDVNHDGLTDLVVAEPDSGQLSVYLQETNGTLILTNTFPTLTGISELAAADWDGDGKTELFVLSRDERQVGIAKFEDKGRVAFPNLLSLEGRPLSMAVGKMDPNGKPMLAIISEQETNRVLITQQSDGKPRVQKLSENFKSTPASIVIHDVDQDGFPDLVVLVPYEKIKVLRQVPGKDFEELDVLAPGGNSEQPWLTTADVDGDGKEELLLAQNNFLRAVVLKMDAPKGTNKVTGSFTVKEQINGTSSNSRITAAAPLRNGTNAVPSLFLIDAEKKAITLCERDATGVWQVVRNVPLPVTDFASLQPISIGSSNVNSLAFNGVNSVGWLNLFGKIWQFTELDHYETPIKDARLTDVISGDLNNDKRKDLVFLETAKNYVDVVTFEPPHNLVPANRWPVFEERTFRSRRSEMPEPREAVVADVTGDGKNDLIVLVHDRVIVYPQE